MADKRLISSALLIMISRAIKVSEEGKDIIARLSLHGEHIIFSVSSEADIYESKGLSSLFCLEKPGDAEEDDTFSAALGLAIVRKIAEKHGGTLVLGSGPDTGIKISMALKLVEMKERVVKAQELASYDEDRNFLIELSDILPWESYLFEEL